MTGALANNRHEAFCLEYTKDRAGGAAYRRAEYNTKSKDVASAASRMLINVKSGVQQRIAELEAEYATKIGFEIEVALNKYLSILNADPAALTSLMRGACRYCQGTNHDFQWRRPSSEYADAVRRYDTLPPSAQARELEPTDFGGYGYRATLSPHPDCPECDGFGIARAHFADTSTIPEVSRPLFAGIEQTQQVIKLKMHDQMAALDALAKHIGFFAKDHTRNLDTSDALTELLAGMMQKSSKMPVNSKSRQASDAAQS